MANSKKKKAFVMPYKKTMNLVPAEQVINWTKVSVFSGIIAVLLIVGLKLCLFDPLTEKNAALLSLSEKQNQYASMSAKMIEYNEVEAQYGKYSYGWMNEQEQAMLSKEKALEIIEDTIASACTVETFSVSNNSASFSISGITLDEGREIVKQLKENKNIATANIYSAVTEDANHNTQMSLVVVFQKEVVK